MVSLRAGGAGKAKIVVRGRGKTLGLPALPLDAPDTVQLRTLDGPSTCWSGAHGFITKNQAHRFAARGGR